MGKNRIKMWYDENEDIFYVSFGKGPSVDSEEKDEGIILEYNKEGSIIGIEIQNITEKLIRPIAKKLAAAVK